MYAAAALTGYAASHFSADIGCHVHGDPYSIDTTFPPTIYTLFYHPRIGPSRPQLARAKGVARAPHPNERTRGAKLVARAAEGGSEHEREVRITWVSLGLGSSG